MQERKTTTEQQNELPISWQRNTNFNRAESWGSTEAFVYPESIPINITGSSTEGNLLTPDCLCGNMLSSSYRKTWKHNLFWNHLVISILICNLYLRSMSRQNSVVSDIGELMTCLQLANVEASLGILRLLLDCFSLSCRFCCCWFSLSW